MPRGVASKDGDTNVAPNGYHYTRHGGKWRLTHHLIAEKMLGRPLESDEMATFIDKDRKNICESNIRVVLRKTSLQGRIATLEDQIREKQAELDKLKAMREKTQRVS